MFTDVRRGAPPLQQLWEKTTVGKTKTLQKKNVTSHDRDCFFFNQRVISTLGSEVKAQEVLEFSQGCCCADSRGVGEGLQSTEH